MGMYAPELLEELSGVISAGLLRLCVVDPIRYEHIWDHIVGIELIFGDGPIQLFVTGSERINWTVNAGQCACLRSMQRCQVRGVISGSFGDYKSGGCGARTY